ncbi:MAG: hypothetical protein U0R24_09475 [Solirubrobacterales bacterium]
MSTTETTRPVLDFYVADLLARRFRPQGDRFAEHEMPGPDGDREEHAGLLLPWPAPGSRAPP